MSTKSQTIQELDLDITGSSIFGRDPKIMASRTFNMIVADNWYIDYAGFNKEIVIAPQGRGRGIFTSIRANILLVVIDNKVYSITVYGMSASNEKSYTTSLVGTIDSFSGDVFIDENNTNQIAICDQHNIYIYNYTNGDFEKATLPDGFNPGYVTYQDGYFIAPDTKSSVWALSAPGDGTNWFWGASSEPVLGSLQTKPDLAIAALRVAGRGNLLFVMGRTVTELWTDVAAATFPYQRSYSVNIDYGCVNPATIASSDHIVAWLGSNEKSGPVIMYSTGSDIKPISTDGINYKFSQLVHPEKSSGFFVKLSGHLIYQLTFYDPADNYSLIYDFTTDKFYDVTDENMNFHPARHVAFFDNDYYFISFRDGNVYRMSASLTTYDYGEFQDDTPKVYDIPRIRVCKNIRMRNQNRYVINNITFTIEQGNDTDNDGNNPNYFPRIALSLSKNGGNSFGDFFSRPMYTVGNRMNRLNWWSCGAGNDIVPQFRFWAKGPLKATDGVVSVYQ